MDPNDVIIPLKTQCLDNSKFLKKKKEMGMVLMMVFSKSCSRERCWSWNCGSEAKGNLDAELFF